MNCKEINENLVAYLDGELPTDRQAEFDEHIAQCEDCAKQLSELRDADAIAFQTLDNNKLGSAPEGETNEPSHDEQADNGVESAPEPPVDFHDEETHVADAEVPLVRPVKWERNIPLERRPVVWIIAAAVVLAVVVYINAPDGLVNWLGRPDPLRPAPVLIPAAPDPSNELAALANACDATITRLLNAQPFELAAISRTAARAGLLGRLDGEQQNFEKADAAYEHIERLKLVMFRLINADTARPDRELASLRTFVHQADASRRSEALLAIPATAKPDTGRQN